MGTFLIVFFIVIGVILAIYLVYYIATLPKRREYNEKLRRQFLLNEERYEAEKAKQIARISGEITRNNIDRIANLHK